jgi:hypothetical protein
MNPLPDNIPIRVYRPELLAEEIQQAGCDAVLFEQWQPLTFLQEPLDIPVFVDLPGRWCWNMFGAMRRISTNISWIKCRGWLMPIIFYARTNGSVGITMRG